MIPADAAVPTEEAYIYRHVVSFEETNLVGNVYFVRHVAWQGRCREMFIHAHAPGVLGELERELRLVTLRVACRYMEELRAFDEIEMRMRLVSQVGHRISLAFDYIRSADGALVAYGEQEIGCMRAFAGGLVPTPPPQTLSEALARYSRRAVS